MTGAPLILPLKKETVSYAVPVGGGTVEEKRIINRRKLKREKRKNRRDRRKDVRDGIVVFISSTKDRRLKRERRHV